MNVLMFSPGFPWEMQHFTRGLAEVGARPIGIGDGPAAGLPELPRRYLHDYIQVASLWDADAVVEQVLRYHDRVPFHRIECLWEPAMLLAARLREALGVPGMGVEQTTLFRDKERMKQALDAAGIRTPRHAGACGEREIRAAAERIGFPLIVKPVAGAGSAHTYRVDSTEHLDEILPLVSDVGELSVEEFIVGEEFTFDTVCVEGQIAYWNVAWYRPVVLIGRTVEWISPQTVTLRNADDRQTAEGREMGRKVLATLGFDTGFTHMEWFRTPAGEAVFGEIAARPPGARSVELMNYACDVDLFRGWAEATVHGTFTQTVERRYNAAVVFKRARGQGRIERIEGLERLVARYGDSVACVDLLPVGASRRNWKQTLLSDGHVIVRHPDLAATLEMIDRFGTDLMLYAGA